MPEIAPFVPPMMLAAVFVALRIARFENQTWFNARAAGMRGANRAVGQIVDCTFLAANFLGWFLLIHIAVRVGWKPALGLLLLSWVGSIVWIWFSRSVFGGNSLLLWVAGTLAVWPLAAWLVYLIETGAAP